MIFNTLDKRPFAEIIDVNTESFNNVKIEELNLSVRANNALHRCNIHNVGELLQVDPNTLSRVKQLGNKSYREIGDALYIFCEQKKDQYSPSKFKNIEKIANDNVVSIAEGDFSVFGDMSSLSEPEQAVVMRYIEAHKTLGQDLILSTLHEPEKVKPIINALILFIEKNNALRKTHEELKPFYDQIPKERKRQQVYYYIRAYTNNNEKLSYLLSFYTKEDMTVEEYYLSLSALSVDILSKIASFFKWMSFDLDAELEDLFSKLYSDSRFATVLKMRASRATLEMAGRELGITRERVRQLENKKQREFNRNNGRIRILQKICALRNGDVVLTPEELAYHLKENTDVVLYLLKGADHSTEYIYDSQSNTFIVGDEDLRDNLKQALVSLPSTFHDREFNAIISLFAEKHKLPRELLTRTINGLYKRTGNIYHRERLGKQEVYTRIIEEFFPDGMRIYDHNELEKFRAIARDNLGLDDLPENDRAISARIASFCVLCGRGLYKLRKDQYIPETLEKEIYSFIRNYPSGVIATNAVFAHFEEELLEYGIDNRYYLHSILHERYGAEFSFRRDYIIKDQQFTSFYQEIVDYIRRSPVAVSKDEIARKYKVSDITITVAASNSSIINYFGEYMYGGNLSLSPAERDQLYNYLDNLTLDDEAHHCRDIYKGLEDSLSSCFNRNGINSPFRLYSVLEYIFEEDFQFQRPFIGSLSAKIDRPAEMLRELILDSDEIEIEEIITFAKEHHYHINSLLDYLNSYNGTHLIKNKNTLISIKSSGITENITAELEEQILKELQGETTLISNLSCVHSFREINVPWTEWLIYSALNKWAKQLQVAPTNSQFRLAAPAVSRLGMFNLEDVAASDVSSSTIIQADDLDQLDELIADYILDDGF